MADFVHITDVGPRDGLQNQRQVLNVEQRLALIDSLYAAGLAEVEVGSFVSPKLVPAMANTDAVVAAVNRAAGRRATSLILNQRGYELARAAGSRSVTMVLYGIARICDESGVDPKQIGRVMHGTTVATNAVLTGKGAVVDDVLLGRLSISQKETDGHYSNVFRGGQGAVDYLEDTTIRGRLIWNASDDVKVDLRAGNSEVEGGAINFNAVFAIPQFETFFNSSYYADVNGHDFIFANNVPGINEQETNEFSIKTDWDRDGVDVSLVVSYSDLEEFLLSDGTSASFYAYDGTDSCFADRDTLNNMPVGFGGAGRADLFGDYFAPFGVNPGTVGEGVYGPYTPTS